MYYTNKKKKTNTYSSEASYFTNNARQIKLENGMGKHKYVCLGGTSSKKKVCTTIAFCVWHRCTGKKLFFFRIIIQETNVLICIMSSIHRPLLFQRALGSFRFILLCFHHKQRKLSLFSSTFLRFRNRRHHVTGDSSRFN